jgi:hypothetical protein
VSLMSKLGVEQKGMFAFTLYYAVAAAANFIVLGLYGLRLFHVGLVAVLSLVAALGLYGLRRWSLWIVVALFFIVTTYGAVMLNTSLGAYSSSGDAGAVAAVIVWIVYLVLTWVATTYVAAKRKTLR